MSSTRQATVAALLAFGLVTALVCAVARKTTRMPSRMEIMHAPQRVSSTPWKVVRAVRAGEEPATNTDAAEGSTSHAATNRKP